MKSSVSESTIWSSDWIEHWGQPSREPDWQVERYGRQKGASVSDLNDILHHLFGRFGRPAADTEIRATDENADQTEHRLSAVEQRQQEIATRLRLLEMTADPRGEIRGC